MKPCSHQSTASSPARRHLLPWASRSGFTLVEIIFVVVLMGLIYSVALPDLDLGVGTSRAARLGRVTSAVRTAFDMAVLYRKPYRLVFELQSGDYWLEETDRRDFLPGDLEMDRDLTEMEEKEAIENFDQEFEEYVDLAGQEIDDPENDRTFSPESPVLQAKDKLRPAKWTRVDSREWKERSLGPDFIIASLQAEHHGEKQTAGDLEEQARAMIYFYPAGYVERAVIHIARRKGDAGIDENEPGYTLVTHPWLGTAEVVPGTEEINVKDDES